MTRAAGRQRPTAGLAEAGAASKITVFGNGLNGPGAMGFQPGIFREMAGQPSSSPLWNHFSAVWKDETKAVLVKSQAELDEQLVAGEIELVEGTPEPVTRALSSTARAPRWRQTTSR